MRKIASLVGACPQFIKEAVVGAEVRRRSAWRRVLVRGNSNITVVSAFVLNYHFDYTFKNMQPTDAIMLKHVWYSMSWLTQ